MPIERAIQQLKERVSEALQQNTGTSEHLSDSSRSPTY